MVKIPTTHFKQAVPSNTKQQPLPFPLQYLGSIIRVHHTGEVKNRHIILSLIVWCKYQFTQATFSGVQCCLFGIIHKSITTYVVV